MCSYDATRIARDWNVKGSGIGYVTRFEVEQAFLDSDEVRQADGQTILSTGFPPRTCRPSAPTSLVHAE